MSKDRMGYESVAEVQPTWHVTARAPRPFPGYHLGVDVLGAVPMQRAKKAAAGAVLKKTGTVASARTASAVKSVARGVSTVVPVTKPGATTVKPASKPVGPTPAQLQAKVDAARVKLKSSAQRLANSAAKLKSKANNAPKKGQGTVKVANRALKIANRAGTQAQKLLTLASKKLTVAPKAVARAGGVAPVGKPAAPKPMASKAVPKTYMRGLDVLGDGVVVGDDLSDARQALTDAQQAYNDEAAWAKGVSDDLAYARQVRDNASSGAPDSRLPTWKAWKDAADKAEDDYAAAMSTAFALIFNDTALGDATTALNDASALVAALEGLPPPPPEPVPDAGSGDAGPGDTGSGDTGEGGFDPGSSGSGGGSSEEGGGGYGESEEDYEDEGGYNPSASEDVNRFRQGVDPFEDEGGGGGRPYGGSEEPMEAEEMEAEEEGSLESAILDEEAEEMAEEQAEESDALAEEVLGALTEEVADILSSQYQHQIADEPGDPIHTHGSSHRGAAYLAQETYPVHGASSGQEGGIMRPEETITVFGATERGLFDNHNTYYPSDTVFHNGENWLATKKVAPPWYSSTSRAADAPGGSANAWRRAKKEGGNVVVGGDIEDDIIFGSSYSRGLDVLGAGPSLKKNVSATTAAKKAQIAATRAKVQKTASVAEKKIATAVARHAKAPPRTHAGAVKAAKVASARAAVVGKRLAKHIGNTKIMGDILGAMGMKLSPKRVAAVQKLQAVAKSVGVSSKHAADAAKAHAAARAKVNANAAAKQKSLKQRQVFKKSQSK